MTFCVQDIDIKSVLLVRCYRILKIKKVKIILILYYYDEFSTKEIAKILDIPQGTVKSRLARGRKQLKDLLEMEGEGAYEGA